MEGLVVFIFYTPINSAHNNCTTVLLVLKISIFNQLYLVFARNNVHSFGLNERKCIEYKQRGFDFLVLQSGFGKSLPFKPLADLWPVKLCQNIVFVVSPLQYSRKTSFAVK